MGDTTIRAPTHGNTNWPRATLARRPFTQPERRRRGVCGRERHLRKKGDEPLHIILENSPNP